MFIFFYYNNYSYWNYIKYFIMIVGANDRRSIAPIDASKLDLSVIVRNPGSWVEEKKKKRRRSWSVDVLDV